MQKYFRLVMAIILGVQTLFYGMILSPETVHAAIASNGTYDDFYFNGDTIQKILVDGNTTYIAGPSALGKTISGYGLSLDVSDADSIGLANSVAVTGGYIRVAVPDGSGGVYIGGTFTSVGGTGRNYVAHIESDGTLDTSWDPNPNQNVGAIAVDGTTIYIGGAFTSMNGTARNYLAAVNNTDGSVTAWDPNMGDEVNDILVDSSNNKVYVAGGWDPGTSGADDGCPGMICALDPSTGNNTTLVDISANDSVYDIELSGSDLYMVGRFTTVGGSGRNRIAKIDTDTDTLDAWNPGANGIVYEVEIYGSVVYVGGAFTTIGTDVAARPYVGALSSTTGASTTWNPQSDATITHLDINSDGSEIFMSGASFTTLSNATATVDHGMAVVSTQSDNGGSTSWIPSFNSGVLIDVGTYLDADNIYIGRASGGSALAAYNYVSTGGLGAVNTSTNKVLSWNPNIGTGAVFDIISDDTYIYVAGTFDTADGQAIPALARYQLISGGGALDAAWDPNFTTAGDVRVIQISGSQIYAGGIFTSVDGSTRNRLASFLISDASLTAWDPNANGNVMAMDINDNTAYITGTFTSVGGESRTRLAGIDLSTGLATTLDVSVNSSSQGVYYDSTNDVLYLAGGFSTVGGEARTGIASIDISSGAVTDWAPTSAGEVFDIEVRGGTAFIAADQSPFFQMIDTSDHTNVATAGIVPDDWIYHILIDDSTGKIYPHGGGWTELQDFTLPTVQFNATTASGSEGDEEITTPQIDLSSSQDDDVSFTVSSSAGTAISGTDFTYTGGASGSITTGNTTTTLNSLTIIDDFFTEPAETAVLTLSNIVFALLGSNTTYTYTITNDDSATATVTESDSSTDVSEAGNTDTYTLVLDSQPTADVTIDITADSNVSVPQDKYTFTSLNWSTPQTVTVLAVDDAGVEGAHSGTITHAMSSADTNFSGVSVASVTVNITDNDSSGSGGGGGSGSGGGSGAGSSGSQGATGGDDGSSSDDSSDDTDTVTPETPEVTEPTPTPETPTQTVPEEDNVAEETDDQPKDTTPTEVPAQETDPKPVNPPTVTDPVTVPEEDNVAEETDDQPKDTTPTEVPAQDETVNNTDDTDYESTSDKLADFFDNQMGEASDNESEYINLDEINIEELEEDEELELKCELKDDIESLRAEITKLRDAYAGIRADIVAKRTAKIALYRDAYRETAQSLNLDYKANVDSARTVYKEQVAQIKLEYSTKLNSIRAQYAALIQSARSQKSGAEVIADLKAKRTDEINLAKQERIDAVALSRDKLNIKIVQLKEGKAIKVADARVELQDNLAQVKSNTVELLEGAKQEFISRLGSIKAKIAKTNSYVRQLKGGSCEQLNIDTHLGGNEDDQDDDGQDDQIEDAIGTDRNDEDTDDDGIDDIDETFTTFTDPNSPDGDETTAGITGQRVDEGTGIRKIKSKGPVVISGIAPEGTKLGCIVEKSPGGNSAVETYRCDESLMVDERGVYMMEFVPRDGDGEYTFRVEDQSGTVARFEATFDSSYRIGMPELQDFAGHTNNEFEYVTDNKVVVNPKVGNFPSSILDPTGCVAFGQCIVQARWNSLIFSSVILADSSAGRAVITPPKELENGEHRVLLTTVDTETNEISETLEVSFEVDDSLENTSPKRINIFTLSNLQISLIAILIIFLLTALQLQKRKRVSS